MSQHINPTPKQTDLTALNSNLIKVSANGVYNVSEGTDLVANKEYAIGNAKDFFGLSTSDTVVGVFVVNIAASLSTLNVYVVGDTLYFKNSNAITAAGTNAKITLRALYI